ncbi:hypothetical protein F5144DRAFT_580491 [Chaetomium tenue]|uniref:Uncharacterized protein n=1 Tax=Chaetomium tenue TaxID=1854479 RepID=A0ACB7P506_9PEZI|nr:hypothetical protein F5144DRAFT_580491 [Chaetomium globosum]
MSEPSFVAVRPNYFTSFLVILPIFAACSGRHPRRWSLNPPAGPISTAPSCSCRPIHLSQFLRVCDLEQQKPILSNPQPHHDANLRDEIWR